MSEEIELDLPGQRFTLDVEDSQCILAFTMDGGIVSLNSVKVPGAVGGRGLAGYLTRHALDWARSEGLKVRPVCPYVQHWIKRHPDYADLVA